MKTDITIEVCNVCAGSCTGCMLSINERRDYTSSMTPEVLRKVASELKAWGDVSGREYRPILVFGDVIRLPLETQRELYDICHETFGSFGLTMTLADDCDRHYQDALLLLDTYPDVIFDITIDPFRMDSRPEYVERLKSAINRGRHLHLQVLLSTSLLDGYEPDALAQYLDRTLGEHPVSLGFTPTVDRMQSSSRYQYANTGAATFAADFYAATSAGRQHLKAEISRFDSSGKYSTFVRESFHIGPRLDVYPVVYTIFGDVILDWRNGGASIGSMVDKSLTAILRSPRIDGLSAQNAGWLMHGDLNCDKCEFLAACEFNGVGLARRAYDSFEKKAGCCYGPRHLLNLFH